MKRHSGEGKSNDGRFEGADGETSCCLHYSRVQRLHIRHAANTRTVAAHSVQLISYHKDLRFGIWHLEKLCIGIDGLNHLSVRMLCDDHDAISPPVINPTINLASTSAVSTVSARTVYGVFRRAETNAPLNDPEVAFQEALRESGWRHLGRHLQRAGT
ncbi:hypothetical protein E4U59_006135 [Claviceps monticola]|nr:hypothetical protein E4U59_006135 [Claviceps monticola]